MIDLAEKRTEIIELLQDRLEDSIDLMMQARQAHLNVAKNKNLMMEKLFGKVYSDADGYIDLIAARIEQLEGYSPGTIQSVVKSGLTDYPLGTSNCEGDLSDLAYSIACYNELIRNAISRSAKLNDNVTERLFTKVSRGVDMNLWHTSRNADQDERVHKSRDRVSVVEHNDRNPVYRRTAIYR